MFEHKIVFMASREPAFAGAHWNRDFYRALGRAIKVARTEQGLERKELARLSGFSYPYLAEIEKGVKRPSTEALIPISQALGLKQSELFQRAERLLERDMSKPGATVSRARARSTPRRVRGRLYELENVAAGSPSRTSLQELVSRAGQLGGDDFHRVLDLVRRLAS
jgi:transcriptional regulator with XRE-family HTH domain